jgi:hypothetical protein
MDSWVSGLSRDRALRRTAAVLAGAAVVLAGLFAAACLPTLPLQQKLWSVAPISPFMSESQEVYDLLKARMKPGDKIIQDGSTYYSHTIVFNVSPNICEDWWERPVLSSFKTPEKRRLFLEASAPGFVLLEKEMPDLPALLNLPREQLPDHLKVRLRLIHSGPRYILYELSPKSPG